MRNIFILGTRGIPACHGGFETFAEKLSIYLSERNWSVHVYCQESGNGRVYESVWRGIKLIHIPVAKDGALGTIIFDWKATCHALGKRGLFLTLGYNTACFNFMQRIRGKVNIFNMDGIEWQREKWSMIARAWFWINERFGCWFGNHLIADHPKIKEHLSARVRAQKITMIPYGADEVQAADESLLAEYGLVGNQFSVIIARPEPENSFLQMVRAFSSARRNHKLVVLGNFEPEVNSYHRSVIDSASDEVIFPGAIYDSSKVQALRFYARFYFHGHRVGGTNPSLVEALGAGCAIIAHDNQFNRWVAGSGAAYFQNETDFSKLLEKLLVDEGVTLQMKATSRRRFIERFTWERVLREYEELLIRWYPHN